MAQNPTDHFNLWAKDYDQYLNGSPHYDILTDCLLDMMRFRAGESILDIGIGTGNLAFKIMQRYNCRVAGIDVSQEMLTISRAKAAEKGITLDLRLEDITAVTHADNSFDAAIAAFALHHVPTQAKPQMFKNIHRVLKPGGRVGIAECLIDVEGDAYSVKRLEHIIQRWGLAALMALKNSGPDFAVVELQAMQDIFLRNHEYLETREKWKSLAVESGFKIAAERTTNPILGHWVVVCEKA